MSGLHAERTNSAGCWDRLPKSHGQGEAPGEAWGLHASKVGSVIGASQSIRSHARVAMFGQIAWASAVINQCTVSGDRSWEHNGGGGVVRERVELRSTDSCCQRARSRYLSRHKAFDEWSGGDSNSQLPACKAGTLPIELPPRRVLSVGHSRNHGKHGTVLAIDGMSRGVGACQGWQVLYRVALDGQDCSVGTAGAGWSEVSEVQGCRDGLWPNVNTWVRRLRRMCS